MLSHRCGQDQRSISPDFVAVVEIELVLYETTKKRPERHGDILSTNINSKKERISSLRRQQDYKAFVNEGELAHSFITQALVLSYHIIGDHKLTFQFAILARLLICVELNQTIIASSSASDIQDR